jgi:predicted MPP superfamily phosphohydrolase
MCYIKEHMNEPVAYLDIISDLHLEFGHDFQLPPVEKSGMSIALLAGDIGHPHKPHYKKFLEKAKKHYDHVLVVAGNHEYYGSTLLKTQGLLREIVMETDCIFLNRDIHVIEGVATFLGCTLWSHLRPEEYNVAEGYLSDFTQIKVSAGEKFSAAYYDILHREDASWLEKEIKARPEENIVVLTHHCPSKKIIHPDYQDHPLNMCFVTNLEHLFQNNVKLWACGHSHKRGVTQINKAFCGLNPRGYPRENTTWKTLRFSLFRGGVLKLI